MFFFHDKSTLCLLDKFASFVLLLIFKNIACYGSKNLGKGYQQKSLADVLPILGQVNKNKCVSGNESENFR